jgi:hypothetical protein
MMKIFSLLAIVLVFAMLISCGENTEPETEGEVMDSTKTELPSVAERLKMYAPIDVKCDISHLTDNQKKCIELLAQAGKIADHLFWEQRSPDGLRLRDSLKKFTGDEQKVLLDYLNINYGPYDVIFENSRFVGDGPDPKPPVANLYPQDMTKEEFEDYIKKHPELKDSFTSQYTIITRHGKDLKAIPYHEAYPKVMEMADLLDEAAKYADNPTLKNYLVLRAKAIREDNYYESDMAWMDIADNDIDVIIGPIENYEDALFNYKTAYEAVVMIKDPEASKELDMFNKNIPNFEKHLPIAEEFKAPSGKSKNILQIVNVAYFGGDCQADVKTIAAALPNDPEVYKNKGGKKSMYKNMMEAKFQMIVEPIAKELLDESILKYVDEKAFVSFVTLHEVSHTLGTRYVVGKEDLTVRKALEERYSAIEECKADILSMHNHKILFDLGVISEDDVNKAKATFLAGLYRSLRFGMESAHGQANLIQLNYLKKSGAIVKENGKYKFNDEIFFAKVAELANLILTCQANGDYDQAGKIMDEYRVETDELKAEIEQLKNIPRDISTTYIF